MTELSEAAVAWLVDGEHGLSSRAMFHHLLLGRPVRRYDYPRDVSDFGRCAKLVEAVPEIRPLIPMMAGVGPEWAAIVRRWDAIETAWESERHLFRCEGTWAILEPTIEAGRRADAVEGR